MPPTRHGRYARAKRRRLSSGPPENRRSAGRVTTPALLANKHKSTVTKMAVKYRRRVTTPDGVLTCFQAVVEREAGKKPLVAQFGGFAIRRRKDAILFDQRPPGSYTRKAQSCSSGCKLTSASSVEAWSVLRFTISVRWLTSIATSGSRFRPGSG